MWPVKCICHDLQIISIPICLRTSPFLIWLGLHVPPFSTLLMSLFFPTCLRTLPSLLDLRTPPISTWFEDTTFPTWFEDPSHLYLIWRHYLPYLIWGPLPSLLDLRTSPFPTGIEDPSLLYLICGLLPSLLDVRTSLIPLDLRNHPYPIYLGTPPFLTWFGDPSIPTCFGLPPFSSPYLDQVWKPYLIWGPFHSLLDLWTSSISTCFKDPYIFFTPPPFPTCLGAGNDLSSSITIFLASSKFFSLLSASSAWNYINISFPDITLKKTPKMTNKQPQHIERIKGAIIVGLFCWC